MGILIAVIAYILIVVVGISYVLNKKQEASKDEFMLSGRNLPFYVVGVTMGLTILGAVHVFGLFEMGFMMGAVSIWFVFAHVIILVIAGFAVGPWIRNLNFSTMPEFLGELYDHRVRVLVLCVTVGVIWGFLTLEAQGLGILFSLFTGWEIKQAIVVGAVLGILYVILAGMKEIGWVNLINTAVMYAGLIVAIIFLATKLPGGNWEAVNNFYIDSDQEWMLSMWGTKEILLTFALSMVVSVVFSQSVNQTLLQSAIAAKDVETVRKATWVSAPVNGLFGVFTIAMGIAAKTMPEFADLGAKMAAPVMVIKLLPPWLVAWLLAGFMGAVLSTFAMHSMTTATIFVKDIYVGFYKPEASEEEQTKLCRLFIVILAATATGVGTFLPTIVAAVSWLSSFLAPVFFFLVFGLFWKRSSNAAVTTLVVAWAVNILWSFTSLPQMLNMAQDINAYVTVGITVVLGTILTAVMDGKPGYFKELKGNKVVKA